MNHTLRVATDAAAFAAMAELLTDYLAWCRERYQDHPWFIERVFGHQSLAAELAGLPLAYSPPRGKALLAECDGAVAGTVAYRRTADGVCEMKRLFVAARFAGSGIGRRLAAAIIDLARRDGYRLMRLDTGQRMTEATAMYRSLGFRPCAAYHDYPSELMPYLVFMELPLYLPA